MRKLATIRRIKEIKSHPNADLLDIAVVDGWQLVTAKDNNFVAGDLVLYMEIDAWIPTEVADFLSKGKEPREFNGVKGERLRTIKLRGELSQGLILPVHNDHTGTYLRIIDEHGEHSVSVQEGDDVTDLLNIQKWEPTIPAQLAGEVKGLFPSFIPKTDQERVQNLVEFVEGDWQLLDFEVSLKLDGTSCTIYRKQDEVGICSRNWELKINDSNQDNSYIKATTDAGLIAALEALNLNIAIQSELLGPGIQSNREGLKRTTLFMFDAYNIDTNKYLTSAERADLYEKLINAGASSEVFKQAPVIEVTTLSNIGMTVNDILAYAEGPSLTHAVREGVVFKCISDTSVSFKSISNAFLLKEKD